MTLITLIIKSICKYFVKNFIVVLVKVQTWHRPPDEVSVIISITNIF